MKAIYKIALCLKQFCIKYKNKWVDYRLHERERDRERERERERER